MSKHRLETRYDFTVYGGTLEQLWEGAAEKATALFGDVEYEIRGFDVQGIEGMGGGILAYVASVVAVESK